MGKKYVALKTVLMALGLRGDEAKYGNASEEAEKRSFDTRTAWEIVKALKMGEVDAEEVTRCKDCRWCLRSANFRHLKCLCPQVPAHAVEEDGYCNYGARKGGGGNG